MAKKWIGAKPTVCDICHHEIGKEFVDGRTKMGPWAIMCAACHKHKGCGLGVGNGQKYNTETLQKVEG